MTGEAILTTAAEESGKMPARKPRLALMGEFSAGKSTLSNMLLGGRALPVRVTATRLPPIWISYGPDSVVAVSHDGEERALSIAELAHVSLEDTKFIRMQMVADTIEIPEGTFRIVRLDGRRIDRVRFTPRARDEVETVEAGELR